MNQKFNGFFTRLGLRNSFRPQIKSRVDYPVFFQEIHNYFHLSLEMIEQEFNTYKIFYTQMNYGTLLGETKTLCLEESFLIYLAAKNNLPQNFCEIGTQYGKSTRRILDIFRLLNVSPISYCYDIAKEIQFVSEKEVCFNLHDLTSDFEIEVLTKYSPELIFLDAHPYELLKKVISEFIKWSNSHPSILAIHDCSSGLFLPKMRIPKNNPALVTSRTGLWERHVLAELFQVPDEKLDDHKTTTHHLKIFQTPHGLALIAPHSILTPAETDR